MLKENFKYDYKKVFIHLLCLFLPFYSYFFQRKEALEKEQSHYVAASRRDIIQMRPAL